MRSLAGLVLSAVVSLGLSGCWGGGPSRVVPPSINASSAAADAVAQYDKDKDGKIAGAELDAAPSLKAAIKQINPAGNSIDEAQIVARINAWKESKVGRTNVAIEVYRRGRPLSGATVTLVPETFLGGNMPTATGTTDESGAASPTAPSDENLPGAPPGFYLVQITKSGENIPDKYNTNTTLGLEVALDSAGSETGYRFDLQY